MACLAGAVFGIDRQAGGVERSFRDLMTWGEQPTVFSLKSRRSLSKAAGGGGGVGGHGEDGGAGS